VGATGQQVVTTFTAAPSRRATRLLHKQRAAIWRQHDCLRTHNTSKPLLGILPSSRALPPVFSTPPHLSLFPALLCHATKWTYAPCLPFRCTPSRRACSHLLRQGRRRGLPTGGWATPAAILARGTSGAAWPQQDDTCYHWDCRDVLSTLNTAAFRNRRRTATVRCRDLRSPYGTCGADAAGDRRRPCLTRSPPTSTTQPLLPRTYHFGPFEGHTRADTGRLGAISPPRDLPSHLLLPSIPLSSLALLLHPFSKLPA